MTGVRSVILAFAALLAAQTTQTQPAQAQTNASLDAGRRLAATHCGRCHAVDRRDQSPDPRAPRLRNLGANFPFAGLHDALRQHMIVGHPEMPVVSLNPTEIGDLMTYLRSIQGPARSGRSKERDT